MRVRSPTPTQTSEQLPVVVSLFLRFRFLRLRTSCSPLPLRRSTASNASRWGLGISSPEATARWFDKKPRVEPVVRKHDDAAADAQAGGRASRHVVPRSRRSTYPPVAGTATGAPDTQLSPFLSRGTSFAVVAWSKKTATFGNFPLRRVARAPHRNSVRTSGPSTSRTHRSATGHAPRH